MTQTEANERDARRYRMLREVMCASEARQDQLAELVAPLLDEGGPTPQAVDRVVDHLLNTLKLV